MADDDFSTVKEQADLRQFAEAKLTRKGNTFVCPFCHSGEHEHGTPAFSIAPAGKTFKCFSCGESGDVIDLAQKVDNCPNKRAALEDVASFFGIDIANPCRLKAKQHIDADTSHSWTAGRDAECDYIARCKAAMTPETEGYAYLLQRGFSAEEIERFRFGWDARRARVVIPWPSNSWYHIDRDVTGRAGHKYEKPRGDDVGPQPLFMSDGAFSGDVLFVVEGALDALAVIACGHEAVALCSTGNREAINAIASRFHGAVMVMLDNDAAGFAGGRAVMDSLTKSGSFVLAMKWCKGLTPDEIMGTKDAAEALQVNRTALAMWLDASERDALDCLKRDRDERYNEALKTLRAIDPAQAAINITKDRGGDPVSTGIAGVDNALGGGLRAGLTILGAVSSLGKTTLAVQIADGIASTGRPVLFVTIEQSAEEIAAKSLSRLMREEGGVPNGVMPTSAIMSGAERAKWGRDTFDVFARAASRYEREVSPTMRILEGYEQPSVADVRAVAEVMADHYGEPPVIFIDYLQLLAPRDDRDNDKQAVDKNVMALRQLARDLRSPILVISSLNRSSYSGSISMDSFKESGAVEYGADVLMGLQPWRMEEQLEDVTESKRRGAAASIMRDTKRSDRRQCELVILKNRMGALPARGVPIDFVPVSCVFTDGTGAQESHRRVL